jgi:hypothetical protein
LRIAVDPCLGLVKVNVHVVTGAVLSVVVIVVVVEEVVCSPNRQGCPLGSVVHF